jgi:magnesium transporter
MSTNQYSICDNKPWIDVISPGGEEMESLSRQFKLNEHIVRDCMEPEHLPKYDLVDDVNFLILRYYTHNPDKRIATIQELSNKIAVFYTDDFLLTIHKVDIPFLPMLHQQDVSKRKCSTIEQFVIKIIWQSLETFDDPAQQLSDLVDFHENNILLHKAGKMELESLYYIKRRASVSHKILLLTLEPINHVRSMLKDDPAMEDVKDQHLKMQTLYSQVLEDVNNLMNLSMSYSAQKTNEVMRVLTLFSAFFLPLTFIVGIYG